MNKEEFDREFNAKYRLKYTLLSEFVDTKTKVTIRHNLCGYEDKIMPEILLKKKHKCNCSKQSKGEYLIEHFLINNNINYITQYSFKDLRYKKRLKFDFGIFNKRNNLKLLIEFDGDFHNKNIYGDLEKQRKRDKIKDEYCKENGIPLERIEYRKINELDDVLSELCIKYNLFDDEDEGGTEFSLYKFEDEDGNIMKEILVDGLVKRNNEIYNIVDDFLSKYDVIVKKRYTFPECRNKNPLPFGYALINPDNNEIITLIELLNESHFKMTYSLESFENTILHDTIKRDFCEREGIKLKRIYFEDFDNIINILIELMKEYNIQYIPE